MHVSIIKRETKPLRFAREVHTRVWLSSRLCFPAPWPHGALKDAGALPPPCLWDLSALGTFNISHLPKETQAQTCRAPAQVHSPAGTALPWDVPMEHQVVLLPPGSSVPLPCLNLAEGVRRWGTAKAQRFSAWWRFPSLWEDGSILGKEQRTAARGCVGSDVNTWGLPLSKGSMKSVISERSSVGEHWGYKKQSDFAFRCFLPRHAKVICDSKDEEFIIKKSWDRARCLHVEDRHREQIYLYPPINKRSQVNHTFVLKLECGTQHVLKKARKFLQTGTAAGGAGSARLPAWMRCCSKAAKGCEAPALLLLLQGEKREHAKSWRSSSAQL